MLLQIDTAVRIAEKAADKSVVYLLLILLALFGVAVVRLWLENTKLQTAILTRADNTGKLLLEVITESRDALRTVQTSLTKIEQDIVKQSNVASASIKTHIDSTAIKMQNDEAISPREYEH